MNEHTPENNTNVLIKITVLVFITILVIVLFLVFSTESQTANNPAESENISLAEKYIQKSDQADALFRTGNVEEARLIFVESLNYATTPEEVSWTQYKISLTETHTNPKSAIALLKQIIANTENSNINRAYAAQRLGLFYLRNSDPNLIPIIFSGQPYEEFYVPNDLFLSLRKLFEYSSSFHPLAISELRVALWYAQAIANDPSTAPVYLPIIESKLVNADLDIKRTRHLSGPSTLINEALVFKARVYAELNRAGYSYDYETAMREAMNFSLASGVTGADGPARFAYAIHLFLYEEGREADVVKLLQPMVDNIDQYPPLKRRLEREKNNVVGYKDTFVQMSNSLPQFKNLLLSLGWTEADF